MAAKSLSGSNLETVFKNGCYSSSRQGPLWAKCFQGDISGWLGISCLFFLCSQELIVYMVLLNAVFPPTPILSFHWSWTWVWLRESKWPQVTHWALFNPNWVWHTSPGIWLFRCSRAHGMNWLVWPNHNWQTPWRSCTWNGQFVHGWFGSDSSKCETPVHVKDPPVTCET